jgi:LuxR family maltose regulon positive regulatory protein
VVGPTFATSKFLAPVPTPRHVSREALRRRLDVGVPLVLVIGSPGAGKTALLAEWFHGRPDHLAAWLNLDQADRDPVHFWLAFVAAMRTCQPGFGSESADLLRLHSDVDHEVLECLLQAGHDLPEPVTLVVDDLHVAAGEVHEQLRFVLSRELGQLRILIGTRAEPAVGLHRLRLDGRVVEVREADLRFCPADAVTLLDRHGVHLPPASFDTVLQRTEGWAAGLQLVALAVRDASDPVEIVDRLSGTNQVIAHYLWSEVFAAQPPDVQRLLVDTCIVDELSPSLAAALSPGNPVTLIDVEAANLLLRRVEPNGQAFRFHQLLTDMLRFRLRATDGAHETVLHERAASWYDAHDEPVAAFRHRWRAGQRASALQVMHGTVLDVVYDDLPMMTSLERSLSDDDIAAAPGPAASFAAALFFAGFAREADRLATRITSIDALPVEVQQQVVFVRTVTALALGDSRRALERVVDLSPLDCGDGVWVRVARMVGARARIWEGQLDVASDELRSLLTGDASSLDRTEVVGALAHLELMGGWLTACSETLAALFAEIDSGPGGELVDGVFGRAVLGALQLERGDTAGAEATLSQVREASSHFRVPALVIADVARSRLWRSDGRHDDALGAVADAYRLIRARPPRSGVLDHVRSQHVRLLVGIGRLDDAAAVLAEIGDVWRGNMLGVELALARGDVDLAVALLTACSDPRPATPRARLELALTSLRVALATGASTADHAATAVEIASSEALLMPVVEAGAEALMTIQAEARRRPRDPRIDALLRLRPAVPQVGRPDGPDALTERERTILRYMVTTMTYREIADELVVSLNTVKTHAKNINKKLQGTSRHDSVRKARARHYL